MKPYVYIGEIAAKKIVEVIFRGEKHPESFSKKDCHTLEQDHIKGIKDAYKSLKFPECENLDDMVFALILNSKAYFSTLKINKDLPTSVDILKKKKKQEKFIYNFFGKKFQNIYRLKKNTENNLSYGNMFNFLKDFNSEEYLIEEEIKQERIFVYFCSEKKNKYVFIMEMDVNVNFAEYEILNYEYKFYEKTYLSPEEKKQIENKILNDNFLLSYSSAMSNLLERSLLYIHGIITEENEEMIYLRNLDPFIRKKAFIYTRLFTYHENNKSIFYYEGEIETIEKHLGHEIVLSSINFELKLWFSIFFDCLREDEQERFWRISHSSTNEDLFFIKNKLNNFLRS